MLCCAVLYINYIEYYSCNIDDGCGNVSSSAAPRRMDFIAIVYFTLLIICIQQKTSTWQCYNLYNGDYELKLTTLNVSTTSNVARTSEVCLFVFVPESLFADLTTFFFVLSIKGLLYQV